MSERDEDLDARDAELMVAIAINKAIANLPVPCGICHWCSEKTEYSDSLYCCKECAEDADKFKRANRRM